MNTIIVTLFSTLILLEISNNVFSQSIENPNSEFQENQIDSNSIKNELKYQAGAILQIEPQNDSIWNLKIDLLERNPKWKPGIDSTGEFFIKLDKILDLVISNKTKSFKCDERTVPGLSVRTIDFVSELQKIVMRFEKDSERFVREPFFYTAYFDIDGTTITAIYEQCLP